MGLPSTDQLVVMALAALEETAAFCRHEPQPHTRGIALALAYLAHTSRSADRSPFDDFWRAMRFDCRIMRPAYASAALEGIYTALGWRREVAVVTRFQVAARERYGPAPGFPNS